MMFIVYDIDEVIRIPPDQFGKPLGEVALQQLRLEYEGLTTEDLGHVIMVTDVDVQPLGRVYPRDGATYHRARCKLLAFRPRVQEVVEGEVAEITDFGAFVRIGPLDALLHVSQVMDDFISYDDKHSILTGKKTGRKLGVGDRMRVRVIAVSFATGPAGKIGVTARQPLLGKIEWIKEELRKTSRRKIEEKEAETGAGG